MLTVHSWNPVQSGVLGTVAVMWDTVVSDFQFKIHQGTWKSFSDNGNQFFRLQHMTHVSTA